MDKIKLKMENIAIEFPGVKALKGVDFSTEGGQIHALVGANGAGKSTLMKVLAGDNTHYTGQIYINDKPVEIRSPKEAKNLGIEIVYQEVDTALIPYLSVAENVMFNKLVNDMGSRVIVNWKKMRREAKAVLEKLNVTLNVDEIVSELSLAQKQMVLISRCMAGQCRLLILDEPTAPLSNTEAAELFRVVRGLAKKNVAVIFISHRLNELYEICDTITIMRDGQNVVRMPLNDDLPQNKIVEYMLGRKFDEVYNKKPVKIGRPVFEVEGLTEKNHQVEDIHMYVREGEIVGLAGLVGAGKTELCKTLFGALPHLSGTVRLHGKVINCTSPVQAVKNGMALVPEERRKEGILITDPVCDNITIASLKKYCGFLSVVNRKKEKHDSVAMIRDLGIKTPSENQIVALLSGGNQQKVVLGKWLNSDAEIYIYDEPTKGIDVGAKRDMYELIERLAARGKGTIYATCEFSEILSICDRIYVMYDGRIVKELEAASTDEQELLYYSTGGRDSYGKNDEQPKLG